jgi:hypothetical protein
VFAPWRVEVSTIGKVEVDAGDGVIRGAAAGRPAALAPEKAVNSRRKHLLYGASRCQPTRVAASRAKMNLGVMVR